MKKMLLLVSLLATTSVTAADNANSSATMAAAEIGPVRQNELLYFIKHDCGSCHGMTLKGGLGPALLPLTLSAKPKGFLVTTIMEGRQNTAMPPWKSMLTYKEAAWITDQLQNGTIQQTELARNNKATDKQTGDNE